MVENKLSIDEIYFAALEKAAAEEQSAYLDVVCADDAALRQRVERLLAAQPKVDSFLETPAPGVVVDINREPSISEQAGEQIGPYKLLEQIGEGGMGVVFKAEQKHPIQRLVAIKIIKPGMDSRQVIARFAAERQALAVMDHSNIARVLDAGTTESGRPYFVMDLVEGLPVTEYCDREHLSMRERLKLMTAVCQAVQHAHQKGIIHRDIKPTNVLIVEDDGKPVPKIIDFGVAKAIAKSPLEKTAFTQVGQIIGTFEYMSPEQARFDDADVDTRTDIYSLGVLLYELLSGDTPFDRQRLRAAALDEVLRIIREDEPPAPSTKLTSNAALPSVAANRHTEPARLSKEVQGELDWIVMKALEKDRNRRYEGAGALAADILHYLSDEPVNAAAPSRLYRARKFMRRNKLLVLASAAVLAGLIVGIIGTTAALISQSRERKQAQLNLATALQSQENYVEAEKLYRQALADAGNTTEDRQRSARILLRLASIVGNWDEAEQLYRQAIDAHREAFPPGDPTLAHALQTFAVALRNGGRAAEAEPLLREAYEIRRNARPADHYATGANAAYLGDALRLLGRYSEAEAMQRAAIAEYQLHSPPPEKLTAFARLGLGYSLVMQGRGSEAEAEMLAAARLLASDYEHIYGERALAWLYLKWDMAEPGKGYDAKFREWSLKSMGDFTAPQSAVEESKDGK
jgi:serine/threonine protein kinase